MKHSVTTLLLKYKLYILAMLKPLGVWGAFVIAFLDSSSIPVPMDIVIAGYVWSDKRHFYIYCLLGALGSAFGGLVPSSWAAREANSSCSSEWTASASSRFATGLSGRNSWP